MEFDTNDQKFRPGDRRGKRDGHPVPADVD